jgi:hypothetical protein
MMNFQEFLSYHCKLKMYPMKATILSCKFAWSLGLGLALIPYVAMSVYEVGAAAASSESPALAKAMQTMRGLPQKARQAAAARRLSDSRELPHSKRLLFIMNQRPMAVSGNTQSLGSAARINAAALPDSVGMEDFNSGTWEPMYNYRFIRNSAGRLTQMRLWIPASFPLPSFQFGSADATYSVQGALTRLSFYTTFPSQSEVFRLVQPVDNRGNCSSAKMYEEDTTTGALVLTQGDSLQYTYTGNSITSFIWKSYDDGLNTWVNVLRVTAIVNNSAGQPTGFDLEFWDESTNSWSLQKARYSGVTWNAGFDSWMAALESDSYIANAEGFLSEGFKDIPRVAQSFGNFPDQYLISESSNGTSFVNSERAYSLISGGKIQRITYQTWTGLAWEPDDRTVYTWTGNQLTMLHSEDSSSVGWQMPSQTSREIWNYNSNGDLTLESGESRNMAGTPWVIDYGNQYAIAYQTANATRIHAWREANYDPIGGASGSGAWDTLARYTLYYSTPSSTCPGCGSDPKSGIYPNPFTNQIQVLGLNQQARWQITDLNGRVLSSGHHRPELTGSALLLNGQNWPQGMYWMQIVGDDGSRSVHRLLKH